MQLMDNKKITKWVLSAISLIIGILIATATPPEGLTVGAMRFMGIFLITLLFLSIETFQTHITIILSLVALAVFGVQTIPQAFGQFGSATLWFIIGVLGFGVALGNSGLLRRIALNILKLFPENFNGFVLAQLAAGTVISPMIPSLAAKATLMSPVAKFISQEIGYENDSKPAGGIFSAAYVSNAILGNMFITGSIFAPALLALVNEKYSFMEWLSGTWVWGIILLVLTFFFIAYYYKPTAEQVANTKVKPGFINEKVAELGPMSKKEIFAAIILVATVVMWVLEKQTGFNNTLSTLIALSLLSVVGLLTPAEFSSKIPWPVIILFGGILNYADLISTLKVGTWLATTLGPILGGTVSNAWLLVPVLCIVTYLLRYAVMSVFATVIITYSIFGPVAASFGIEPFLVAFTTLTAANVYTTSFNNTNYIAAQAAAGGMVTYKSAKPMAYAYLAINLIACLVSIPLWKLLGWC